MKLPYPASAALPHPISRRRLLSVLPLAAAGSLSGCAGDGFFGATQNATPGTPPLLKAGATAGLMPALNATQIGFGLHHYLVTGQSLACGTEGYFGISNTQPFNNRMFGPADIYNLLTLGTANVQLVPLISGPQVRETIGNGFADSLTARARPLLAGIANAPADYQVLISNSGVEGARYARLAGPTDYGGAGSPPFQEMMSQVSHGMQLAASLGLTYRVAGMVVVHGEFDEANPYYFENLQTWQSDTQKGVQAITGQTSVIPMIAAQTQTLYSTWEFEMSGAAGLYNAAAAEPTKIFLACPEYAMQHHLSGETVFPGNPIHMTANGYRHLGMMMAKAAFAVTMENVPWTPLTPVSLEVSGNQIVVTHFVPHGPLVLDTSWVSDPGNFGYHFYNQHDAQIAITQVAVTSATEVTLTFNKPPTTGMLGYANFAPPSDPSYTTERGGTTADYGPTRGPRGCLRDSDPAVAYYAPTHAYTTPAGEVNQYPMQNYCAAWQINL